MNFTTVETITNLSLNNILEKHGLNYGDGYDLSNKILNLKEEDINKFTTKKFLIIGDDAFPFNNKDASDVRNENIAIFSKQIINNLLQKDGLLIIINSGKNFINKYLQEFLNNNDKNSSIYTIESFEEDIEANEDLIDAGSRLESVAKRYGTMLKYIILTKNISTPKEKIQLISTKNEFTPDLNEHLKDNNQYRWEVDFVVNNEKYTLDLTIDYTRKTYTSYLRPTGGKLLLNLNNEHLFYDGNFEKLKNQLLQTTKTFLNTDKLYGIKEMTYQDRLLEKLKEIQITKSRKLVKI